MLKNLLVVTFEFTGAARGFTIMSCAARGVKKVGQHCITGKFFIIKKNLKNTKT